MTDLTPSPLKAELVGPDLSAIAGVTVHANGWTQGVPAVYVFNDCDISYYVGIATNVARRLQEHRRAGLGRVDGEYVEVDVYPMGSLKAAQRLERNLILFLEPKANTAVPGVSENERAWFDAVMDATGGRERNWGYCPECGELMIQIHDTMVPATRGAQCADCQASPQWDPSERCWRQIAEVVAALFGQSRPLPAFFNFGFSRVDA